jgi:2,3-bisphosphoglycerate-independent phosphoglycerate mutase
LLGKVILPTRKTEASTTDGTKEGKKRVIEGIDEVAKVIKKETVKTKHKIKKIKTVYDERLKK